MNSISKKALLSMLMLATAGVVNCAGENFAPAPMSTAVRFVVGSEQLSPDMAADVEWTKALMPVSLMPVTLTRFERFKAACGNAVEAVRATRPVQYVEATVTKYPRASKVVAGTAVVAAVYAAANTQRGQKVRAQIANSPKYKAVANFVQTNKKALVGAVVVAAAAVGGNKYVLPRITQWLAEAAC
ncbi:MAG TPA: hypothetical protein VGT41_00715 [Candidatus Babeliales bacterium]|nr:hypothetical protein [Candidatus Babeliales bacterium]